MEGPSFSDPFKKNDQKPISQIGTGEGESPLARPSAPSLETRTFSSDLNSIKTSGGAEPAPYAPSAAPRPPVTPSIPSTSPKPSFVPPSGMAMGNDTLPKPGGIPPITPIPAPISGASSKSGGKKIFIAILSFLIVVGLGAVGYFFVYPLFTEEPILPPAPEAPTLPETPEPFQPSEPASTTEEAATSTEETSSPESETSAPDPWSGIQGLSSHRSLFVIAPDATTEIILTSPTLTALKAALPSGAVASPRMSEVVLKMPSGRTIPFSRIAPLFTPTFFSAERLSSFDDDATYFTYAAANGTWLGMAVPLKSGVPIGPVQDGMSALQSDPGLANFFLEEAGAQGVWADGSVREKPTSQVSFEAPGATFSYTWFDRTLLISTNLTGAGMAAERLGF